MRLAQGLLGTLTLCDVLDSGQHGKLRIQLEGSEADLDGKLGAISALGRNTAEFAASLREGRGGIGQIESTNITGLRFQNGGVARVVSISLKARAAIMLAGHRADMVTWFDGSSGAWVTSSVYGRSPFVEEYAKARPAREDHGKTWSLALPTSAYFYEQAATGAIAPPGWGLTFPHALRGKAEGAEMGDAAPAGFADLQELAAPDRTVGAVAGSVKAHSEHSFLPSLALGKHGSDVGAVVLNGSPLRGRQFQRMHGRPVLRMRIVSDGLPDPARTSQSGRRSFHEKPGDTRTARDRRCAG